MLGQAAGPARDCGRPCHNRGCDGVERDNRRPPAYRLPRPEPVVIWVLVQLLQRRQQSGLVHVLVRDSDVHRFGMRVPGPSLRLHKANGLLESLIGDYPRSRC